MTADRDFLFWLQARLIGVYKEDANTDFVLKLGYIAASTPPNVDTWTGPKGRFHVLGETSTEGPRWQLWDNESKRSIVKHIKDVASAHQMCHLLNRQDQIITRMREKDLTIKVPEEA